MGRPAGCDCLRVEREGIEEVEGLSRLSGEERAAASIGGSDTVESSKTRSRTRRCMLEGGLADWGGREAR